MLASGWPADRSVASLQQNAYCRGFKGQIEKLELLLYRYFDLMDKNISVMNKYSELY
jgi:hypothetical protein